ncbi:hypothetical protein BG58_11135 [Caballeronia jiangsuensis]|nr:hypothetical protein BG58_11135 [Caballeronia jiangsuensis]
MVGKQLRITKQMKVEFSINKFMFSHAKAPKGFGMWLFEAHIAGDKVELSTPHAMTYGEAKKEITKQVRDIAAKQDLVLSTVYVVVLP